MNSTEESGLIARVLRSKLLIYVLLTTLSTAAAAFAISLTGEHWIAMLIPLAPALAAIGISVSSGRVDELKGHLRSVVNGQIGGRWFATSTLALPIVGAVAVLLYVLTGDSELQFGVPRVVAIFVALPLAMCNELGWRGFAPQHLNLRSGRFVESLVIGALWIISISPIVMVGSDLLVDVPAYQIVLTLVPISVLATWMRVNTKSLLAPAIFLAAGIMTIALLPILPGDSAQGVTLWFVIGFLWLFAVVVVGRFGTDGLDRSIHMLPAEELPVGWDKIMPDASKKKGKTNPFRSSRPKNSFSAVGRRRR